MSEKEHIRIEISHIKFIQIEKNQEVKQVDFTCPTCETQIIIKTKLEWQAFKDIKLLCPFCNLRWEIKQERINK